MDSWTGLRFHWDNLRHLDPDSESARPSEDPYGRLFFPYQAMLMLSRRGPMAVADQDWRWLVDTAEIYCISVFFFHVSLGVYIQYIYISLSSNIILYP